MTELLSDDEYEVPLRDQRNFGSGLRRKGIAFVRSTTAEDAVKPDSSSGSRLSAAERYLAIAFRNNAATDAASSGGKQSSTRTEIDETQREFCETCQIHISANQSMAQHVLTMTHQIKMPHSHPPSHLDRRRMGLGVLQQHGWDPDERKGLGADGTGVLFPIVAKENPHRAGLGAKFAPLSKVEKPVRLHAGAVRAAEQAQKRKAEALRSHFYGNQDVDKYLGTPSTSAEVKVDDEKGRRGSPKVAKKQGRWV